MGSEDRFPHPVSPVPYGTLTIQQGASSTTGTSGWTDLGLGYRNQLQDWRNIQRKNKLRKHNEKREKERERVRVVHILCGDGINTNENASKRVLQFFRNHSTWGRFSLHYRVILIRCASHQANLVVLVGICQAQLAKAADKDEVCLNCVRLFKYLLPDYIGEFSSALRQYVQGATDGVGTDGVGKKTI